MPERRPSTSTPTARATRRSPSPTSRAWSRPGVNAHRRLPRCRRGDPSGAAQRLRGGRRDGSLPRRPGRRGGDDYNVCVGSDFRRRRGLGRAGSRRTSPTARNILFLSGPAGNTQGIVEREGLKSVLTDPKYVFIGEQPFEVTNWDPAQTQQVLTAAIAQVRQIDVIVSDFGPSLVGALPEFEKSGRSIPALVTSDGNVLSCFYEEKAQTTRTSRCSPSRPATTTCGSPSSRRSPGDRRHPAERRLFERRSSRTRSAATRTRCSADNLPPDIYLSAELSGRGAGRAAEVVVDAPGPAATSRVAAPQLLGPGGRHHRSTKPRPQSDGHVNTETAEAPTRRRARWSCGASPSPSPASPR